MSKEFKFWDFVITQKSNDYMLDYWGMNFEASKSEGFDKVMKMKKDEILINSSLHFWDKIHTIIHEITECKKMRSGLNFVSAHTYALYAEDKEENLKELSNLVNSEYGFMKYLIKGATVDNL
jgi:hypothetical protein